MNRFIVHCHVMNKQVKQAVWNIITYTHRRCAAATQETLNIAVPQFLWYALLKNASISRIVLIACNANTLGRQVKKMSLGMAVINKQLICKTILTRRMLWHMHLFFA